MLYFYVSKILINSSILFFRFQLQIYPLNKNSDRHFISKYRTIDSKLPLFHQRSHTPQVRTLGMEITGTARTVVVVLLVVLLVGAYANLAHLILLGQIVHQRQPSFAGSGRILFWHSASRSSHL